ncbi:MAG: hypothetical protein NZ700_02055 [Gemmataceae bacterium]|nr:hypothetical protein [Gemmataceae bacterium]MDW8265401.1 hypothetical protein [Gemmataceae bacterium]
MHWANAATRGREMTRTVGRGSGVLWLALILAFVWLTLAVLFWVGSLWIQGYVYNEAREDLYWRAPVAAAVLALFLAGWTFLAYTAPGQFDVLTSFNPVENRDFEEFWGVRGSEKVRYQRSSDELGRPVYLDSQRRPAPEPLDEIIVKEGEAEVVFRPERDAQGNFKVERGRPVRYRDDRGRIMERPGTLTSFRWGLFVANLGLNAIHLAAWFLSVWLLLRFQWSHALGLACVCWLVMTLTIVPLLLGKAAEWSPPPPGPTWEAVD